MRKIPHRRLLIGFILIVLLAGGYLYMRPLAALQPSPQTPTQPAAAAISLPWPGAGQAAIGAAGYGVLASQNTATPVSIASIAKVITALAVLQQRPITDGKGPAITMDATDVSYYSYYTTRDGSAVKVTAGEQLSEYQALQAMLIPSANNVGDSLARWAFGSVDAYLTYANQMVKDMGLKNTTVGNTNGFDDTTLSTADDLVKLGLAALQNPIIADVTGQSSADIPVAGTVRNVNWLLGSNGVVGIKTGNTDKAGGCYLFAAKQAVSGQMVTVVGAVMGAPSLTDAISAAPPLLRAAYAGFGSVTPIYKDEALAYYLTPWQDSARLVSPKDLSIIAWKGQAVKISSDLIPIKLPAKAGTTAGSVTIQSGSQKVTSPLVLSKDIPGPSWHWRVFRK